MRNKIEKKSKSKFVTWHINEIFTDNQIQSPWKKTRPYPRPNSMFVPRHLRPRWVMGPIYRVREVKIGYEVSYEALVASDSLNLSLIVFKWVCFILEDRLEDLEEIVWRFEWTGIGFDLKRSFQTLQIIWNWESPEQKKKRFVAYES